MTLPDTIFGFINLILNSLLVQLSLGRSLVRKLQRTEDKEREEQGRERKYLDQKKKKIGWAKHFFQIYFLKFISLIKDQICDLRI